MKTSPAFLLLKHIRCLSTIIRRHQQSHDLLSTRGKGALSTSSSPSSSQRPVNTPTLPACFTSHCHHKLAAHCNVRIIYHAHTTVKWVLTTLNRLTRQQFMCAMLLAKAARSTDWFRQDGYRHQHLSCPTPAKPRCCLPGRYIAGFKQKPVK